MTKPVCAVCGESRSNRESDPHGQFGHHDFVAKQEPAKQSMPQPDLHDAAMRAGVWSVIAARAKELADAAKAELAALEVGDTVAGKWDGQVIAKATMTKGRERIIVRDEQQFLEWVRAHHETEIVESVNPAFLHTLKAVGGVVIDAAGEPVEGVELRQGSPYVTVRKDRDAMLIVAQLLSSGQLSLEGPRDWQAEVEAGAIGDPP